MITSRSRKRGACSRRCRSKPSWSRRFAARVSRWARGRRACRYWRCAPRGPWRPSTGAVASVPTTPLRRVGWCSHRAPRACRIRHRARSVTTRRLRRRRMQKRRTQKRRTQRRRPAPHATLSRRTPRRLRSAARRRRAPGKRRRGPTMSSWPRRVPQFRTACCRGCESKRRRAAALRRRGVPARCEPGEAAAGPPGSKSERRVATRG